MNLSVPKKTGTYADTLQAIGLADLVKELCNEDSLIADGGSEFKISVKEWNVEKWSAPNPGYTYIWDSKKEQNPPPGDVLGYRREIEKRDAARELKKGKATARRKIKEQLQNQGIDEAEPPKPELALATILASMRKGWDGDRQLYRWLTEDRERALRWIKYKLGVDAPQVEEPKWSNTQFLNPVTGKGVHSPKTIARAANAINAVLTDPFEDWLKLRAIFKAMLAYRNGDDFKFFVLEPAQASPAMLAEITSVLRKLDFWGGVKLDIEAVLECTRMLINHSDVMANGPIKLKGRTPRDIISGLRQSYFKSLGTAAALMNDALFPLPAWFSIENLEEGNKMLGIIGELIGDADKQGCLSSLQESHSDEGSTLQLCRDWLATGRLNDLLSFHASFATYVMQKRSRQEWVRPFFTENLTFLLSRGYYMNDIVTNRGFLSIAHAIRNATIYSIGKNALVEINTHFGLAQKWKQKLRSGGTEFITAVADFVQQYNWEVIDGHERKGKPRYHTINTSDLDDLSQLIKSHGAETVGLLLLAYGYAQAAKTKPSTGENA
ncbi:MAG TPA: hypothetical protein VGY31_07150 [Terriglobia bacterium]|nr:hypothetical protein [Terriglobia bacterium]